MSTYHVVTVEGETRVEGDSLAVVDNVFSVRAGKDDVVFLAPITSLVYVKLISADPAKIVLTGPAIDGAEVSKRLQRIKADVERGVYTIN